MRRLPLMLLLAALAHLLAGCATSVPAAVRTDASPTSIAAPTPARADLRRAIAWTTTPADAQPLRRRPALPLHERFLLCEGRPRALPEWLGAEDAGAHASRAATLGVALASLATLRWADASLVRETGDHPQRLMPAAGAALALLQQDWEGVKQLGFSLGTTLGLTHLLKDLVTKRRPDGANGESFPSGHTAAAFAGAAFLHERYGPRLGLPAYALAVHTALTRVVGDKHHVDDVIAGAGIGLLSTWLFVRPCCDDPLAARPVPAAPAAWRVVFSYGAILEADDEVRAPRAATAAVNLCDVHDGDAQVTATARALLEWRPAPRHVVSLRADPTDIADAERLAAPLTFGGSTFAAGTRITTRHHHHRYRVGWRYELMRRGPVRLAPGAGLLVTDYRGDVAGGGARERVDEVLIRPVACVVGQLLLGRALRLQVDVEGTAVEGSEYVDAAGQLIWQVDRRWDLGVGYRRVHAVTRTRAFLSKLETGEVFLAFGYAF